MVDFLLSAERTFGAGHVVPDDPAHQFPHGHHWATKVTVRGLLDPVTGSAGKLTELTAALEALVSEVEGKSFNDMVPQTKPTLEGVGMWFLDRLVPAYPKLVEVEIGWLDPPQQSCLIQRQPR